MSRTHKVFVAYPIYDKADPRAQMSKDRHCAYSKLCDVETFSLIGDSAISRARDKSINVFLKSDCEYYMTWDCDIEVIDFPDKASIFDIWVQAIQEGKELIGGLVAKTGQVPSRHGWNIASVPVNGDDLNGQERWVEMQFLGGALTFMPRATVQKIYDAHHELEYDAVGFGDGGVERALYLECISTQPNGKKKRLTEDWAFCDRFRKIGGKIHADKQVMTIHWGLKGWVVRPELERYSNVGCF